MARAPRKPTATPLTAATIPVIPVVAASEDSVSSAILPTALTVPFSDIPASAEQIPGAAGLAAQAVESTTESAAAVIDAAVQAGRETAVAAMALPKALAAPISSEATIAAPKAPAALATPTVAAAQTAAALAPAKAADAIAANVTALCESGMALMQGFERFHVRLAEMASDNLRQGLALQQAMLGLGTTDALAKRSPAWIGERIGAYASAPGDLAMIALETAEAAARPVVRRARERLAGGVPGNIV